MAQKYNTRQQQLRAGVKFTLPMNDETWKLISRDKNKIVVVSVFGKSESSALGCKTAHIDALLGSQIFHTQTPPSLDQESLSLIEGYYDKASCVIYLHLRSVFDSHHFLESYGHEAARLNTQKFQVIHAELCYRFSRALMFLFSLSHILIVTHPRPRFDEMFLRCFRAIESIRTKTGANVEALLRNIPEISRSWLRQMRPCTPRLLFLFETSPKEVYNSTLEAMGKNIGRQKLPIKIFEHSLENQIYHVACKFGIISNVNSKSLFAIPVNQEFVHVQLELIGENDHQAAFVNSLINICQGGSKSCEPIEISFSAEKDHSFQHLLKQHIEIAQTKGFHESHEHFELPLATVWLQACDILYHAFIKNSSIQKIKIVMDELHSAFDASVRLSETLCKKSMVVCGIAYRENLPMYYTKAYHEGRVAHAISILMQQARGPLCEQYINLLKEECDKYWMAGHQMCEVLSLKGNPCTNPVHGSVEEEEPCQKALTKKQVKTMPHSSGVRYISTCNCGGTQGPREDPFLVRAANCDFYSDLAKTCCEHLEQHNFPVFTPNVHNNCQTAKMSLKSLRCEEENGVHLTQESLSGAFYSCQSEDKETSTENYTSVPSQEESFSTIISNKDTNNAGGLIQSSTSEYLPGMLHMQSPQNVLPKFSSWSLLCLGLSSKYGHKIGIADQPGFLPGSGYLLPWNAPINHQQPCDIDWPVVSHSLIYSKLNIKDKSDQIKIFIGIEYECPKGHRFMCSAPNRMLQSPQRGLVNESGEQVVKSDMPLYFKCPCNSEKLLIAQLMRVHIITPKAPAVVTLNPKVQPAPEPCPTFITEPVRLSQNSYWVLRLPYIYSDEQGVIPGPKNCNLMNYGRLLAGICKISVDKIDEKS